MKKIITLAFLVLSIGLNAQTTYKHGVIDKKIYSKEDKYLKTEMGGYNASVTVNDDKSYDLSFKVGYGIDGLKLTYVKKTSFGPKYQDNNNNFYYVEDDLKSGSFTYRKAELVDGQIVRYYIYSLVNEAEEEMKNDR